MTSFDPRLPVPGWYPDPWNPGALRWWDGATWTDQARWAGAPQGPVLDLEGGRRWATNAAIAFVFIGAVTALNAFTIPLLFHGLFDTIEDSVDTGTDPTFGAGATFAILALNLTGLVSLAAQIVVGMWSSKATTNARAMDQHTTHSPGWAIAAWFVPFVSLWFPFQVVRDLIPAEHPLRSRVPIWWALYLGSQFLVIVPMVAALTGSLGLGAVTALLPAALGLWAAWLGRTLALAVADTQDATGGATRPDTLVAR